MCPLSCAGRGPRPRHSRPGPAPVQGASCFRHRKEAYVVFRTTNTHLPQGASSCFKELQWTLLINLESRRLRTCHEGHPGLNKWDPRQCLPRRRSADLGAGRQVGGEQVVVRVQVRSRLTAAHERSHVHVHVAVFGQALHDVVVHLPPAITLSATLTLSQSNSQDCRSALFSPRGCHEDSTALSLQQSTHAWPILHKADCLRSHALQHHSRPKMVGIHIGSLSTWTQHGEDNDLKIQQKKQQWLARLTCCRTSRSCL